MNPGDSFEYQEQREPTRLNHTWSDREIKLIGAAIACEIDHRRVLIELREQQKERRSRKRPQLRDDREAAA
jgi:hypothetical protein